MKTHQKEVAAMLTNLGRFLRKLRIDHSEILKNMADRFGVTASYLSAVENGKRAIPEAWEGIILKNYPLDEGQKHELHRAVIESIESINLNMSSANYANKEVAFAFARKVVDLPEDKLEEIKRILGGE
jgi:transcriptional regulator with XRE-family HTH domain